MKNVISCTAMLCMSGICAAAPLGTLGVPRGLDPVDVLVVGGTSTAVAAAAAAAKSGASVALLAPRPFLGEDLCETNRFVELPDYTASELPLLRAMSAPPPLLQQLPPTVALSYEADQETFAPHKDTPTPSILCDHKIKRAENGSVQYNSDVTLTVTIKKPEPLDSVTLLVFQGGDYKIGSMTVEACVDGVWKTVGSISNGMIDNVHTATALPFKVALDGLMASQLKLHVKKLEGMPRMLLGEICITSVVQAAIQTDRSALRLAPYPNQVKRVLETELFENGVKFLYSSPVVAVLKDDAGAIAGVVMANRSGWQYVQAKTVIDATENSFVARLAGAEFRPSIQLKQTYTRYILGGDGHKAPNGSVAKLQNQLQITGGSGRLDPIQPIWKYTFKADLPQNDFAAMMAFEQQTRDWTWNNAIAECTGRLYAPATSRIVSQGTVETLSDLDKLPLTCFRVAGQDRLFVSSQSADVSLDIAMRLQDIEASLRFGDRLGRFVADIAAKSQLASKLTVCHQSAQKPNEISVLDSSYRFKDAKLACNSPEMPILGTYDVIVVGGGTAGAPAAIGAARQGAKTLLVEYLNELGGTSTAGGIARYYYGNICGFTKEMDDSLKLAPGTHDWSRQGKSEWYRAQFRASGGVLWTSTMVTGALMDDSGKRVVGIVVATPFGPGRVYAHTVIDSTGNSDVPAAAGAPCQDQDDELGVQGTGLSPQRPGDHYINTDYVFSDDGDVIDVWRTFILGRERYKDNFDIGQIIGSRERRRIIGDTIIMPIDIFNRRTYPDTICVSMSNFDSHGYTVHPLFVVHGPDQAKCWADVPLRALLPKGIDGVMSTGLGLSGHRDTMPILRMQPDVQNHGYAAGVAAAMAAKNGVDVRRVDIKKLQRHLVDIGNVPARVLTDVDSYPLPIETLRKTVANLDNDWKSISILLSSPKDSLPMLHQAYLECEMAERKYQLALLLALLGDAVGKDTLLQAIAKADDWDEGWNYRGMGQYGPSTSPLDGLILALGRIQAREAEADILRLVAKMTPQTHFSHFRCISLSLEQLGGEASAKQLYALLQQKTMTGHDQPINSNPRDFAEMQNPDWRRTEELRELFVGCALYRLGDVNGLGRDILERYANDGRGVYARHARFVLDNK